MKTFLSITSRGEHRLRLGLGDSCTHPDPLPFSLPATLSLWRAINTETGTDGLEAINTSSQKGSSCLINVINIACLHAAWRKEGAEIRLGPEEAVAGSEETAKAVKAVFFLNY